MTKRRSNRAQKKKGKLLHHNPGWFALRKALEISDEEEADMVPDHPEGRMRMRMYCVRIDPWDSIPATKPYHFVPAEDTYEAVHLATMGFKAEAYMWAPERTKVTDRIRADMKLQDSYMDLRVYMYCPDHNRWAKYRIYPVPQWTTEVAKDDDELKFVVRRKRTTKSRERYTVLPMGEVSEPPLYP